MDNLALDALSVCTRIQRHIAVLVFFIFLMLSITVCLVIALNHLLAQRQPQSSKKKLGWARPRKGIHTGIIHTSTSNKRRVMSPKNK